MPSSVDSPTLNSPEESNSQVQMDVINGIPTSTRKLRVVQIVEATNAGVGQHVLDMVGGLLNKNVEVHVIYSSLRMSRPFKTTLLEHERNGAILIECPISSKIRPSDLTSSLFVRKYLKENGPFDIVHGHSSKGGAIARLAALGLKVPVFFTPNAISTLNPMVSSAGRLFYGIIERILWKMTTRLIATSPEECAHCIELGIPEAGITVLPNGLNGIELPSQTEVREKYGLPLDKTILGFVGRFSPQKGPEIMLKAFALVAPKFPNAILAMIGGGEQEEELKQFVQENNLSSQVRFLGVQPGNWSMPAFDVFCMTSRYEGYPYVVLEAAHASLPIIMTRFQCDTLMVDEGVNGYVVETDNWKMMASAIEKLLSTPENIPKFGQAAHEKYKVYSADAMVDQCLALYQAAVK